jgi:hypothetical protein
VSNQQSPDHAVGAVIVADALGPNVLQKLHRRSQAANRDWFRAESDLRRRQAERLSHPANPDPPAAAAPHPPEPAPPPVRNEPNPVPATNPQPPPSFNPRNPHHPPIELCPSCLAQGRIHDRCYFQPREPRK